MAFGALVADDSGACAGLVLDAGRCGRSPRATGTGHARGGGGRPRAEPARRERAGPSAAPSAEQRPADASFMHALGLPGAGFTAAGMPPGRLAADLRSHVAAVAVAPPGTGAVMCAR